MYNPSDTRHEPSAPARATAISVRAHTRHAPSSRSGSLSLSPSPAAARVTRRTLGRCALAAQRRAATGSTQRSAAQRRREVGCGGRCVRPAARRGAVQPRCAKPHSEVHGTTKAAIASGACASTGEARRSRAAVCPSLLAACAGQEGGALGEPKRGSPCSMPHHFRLHLR